MGSIQKRNSRGGEGQTRLLAKKTNIGPGRRGNYIRPFRLRKREAAVFFKGRKRGGKRFPDLLLGGKKRDLAESVEKKKTPFLSVRGSRSYQASMKRTGGMLTFLLS